MLGLFWEFHQQSRISEVQRQARQSESTANETRRKIAELEDRVDRLTMITAAIWKLLQQRTGMTDEQLSKEVEAIDLSDGRLDGRVRRDAIRCPKCSRAMAPRHLRCIYCGEQAMTIDAFDRAY